MVLTEQMSMDDVCLLGHPQVEDGYRTLHSKPPTRESYITLCLLQSQTLDWKPGKQLNISDSCGNRKDCWEPNDSCTGRKGTRREFIDTTMGVTMGDIKIWLWRESWTRSIARRYRCKKVKNSINRLLFDFGSRIKPEPLWAETEWPAFTKSTGGFHPDALRL